MNKLWFGKFAVRRKACFCRSIVLGTVYVAAAEHFLQKNRGKKQVGLYLVL